MLSNGKFEENDVKDVKVMKQEPITDDVKCEITSGVKIEENDVKDVKRVKQESISSSKITSKRKIEENDIKNIKLLKRKPMPDMYTYIERERRKLLTEAENIDVVERYLYDSVNGLRKNSSSSLSFERLTGFLGSGTYSTRNANIFRTSDNPFMLSSHNSWQPSFSFFDLNTASPASSTTVSSRPAGFAECAREVYNPLIQNFNMGFDPVGPNSTAWVYRRTGEQLYLDSLQREAEIDECRSTKDDPMWGSHLQNSSPVSENALMAQLIVILRDWSVDMYKKCMDDYKRLRNEKPEFWDKILLKALPPALLEHCTEPKIVTDFFHTLCRSSKTIIRLVKIKSCYLHFFLMNMAAVNCIEISLTIDIDIWSSAKRELIERAFVAGQTTNLQLLLQYFRPKYLWSNNDMEFLKAPTTNWETRAHNIDNVARGYYDKLILLNIVRLAALVSESPVHKSVKEDCIRLFWRASVEPYVTLEDIEDAFKPLNCSMLLRHTLIRACKKPLLDVYPVDCFADYQPRSLMHLSRYAVRQGVISAAHVLYLPLPESLRAYVNLEW